MGRCHHRIYNVFYEVKLDMACHMPTVNANMKPIDNKC